MQRAFGLNIPQTLEDVCNPTRLALVVYDMQVGIINQIKNGPEITGKVLQVLQGARQAGIRVFLYPAHVTPQGTHGSLPIAHGHGLATGEVGG